MNINQVAHRIGMATELRSRDELAQAVRALRDRGADAAAIRDYLARCCAAGRVLDA